MPASVGFETACARRVCCVVRLACRHVAAGTVGKGRRLAVEARREAELLLATRGRERSIFGGFLAEAPMDGAVGMNAVAAGAVAQLGLLNCCVVRVRALLVESGRV